MFLSLMAFEFWFPAPNAEDRFTAEDLRAELKARGISLRETATAVRVYLLRDDDADSRAAVLQREGLRFDDAMRPEGYVLGHGQA